MELMFETFHIYKDDTADTDSPFMIACKDRAVKGVDERWVVCALSNEEMRRVYEYLRERF